MNTNQPKGNKKRLLNEKRLFLLTFFDKEEYYKEKEVNGWWLIKQWDGDRKNWQVAIYSQQSFNNYKKQPQQNELF